MNVRFEIDVYDGAARRTFTRAVVMDAVPRQGEWVETTTSGEWAAETVRSVTWLPLEPLQAIVHLDLADTSNDDDPEAYERALRENGWQD